VCGKVEIGATLRLPASARTQAVAAAQPFRPVAQHPVAALRPALGVQPLAILAAATVQLGVDRARE